MNAVIRGLKGALALLALAGLGLVLRWMTAGSIGAANSNDLDSMAVLTVGTVAWMAYGWLVLAVLVTVLEQLPGAVGSAASAVAGRITSQTSRALLRSALGVAAVTPLTVGVAHATPGDGANLRLWAQMEPGSAVQFTGTPDSTNWRATEPPSSVRLTGATGPQTGVPATGAGGQVSTSGTSGSTEWRATEPPSSVRLTGATPSQTGVPGARPSTSAQQRTDKQAAAPPRAGEQAASRVSAPNGSQGKAGTGTRVAVPDRPTAGAPTRYTDLRSGQAARVVVRPGDSLWSIAATELGPNATAEAIAARWPAWYAANRQLIGPDPDLILPGQVLRTPAAATGNPVPPTHQEK
jgi:hypothetical protein